MEVRKIRFRKGGHFNEHPVRACIQAGAWMVLSVAVPWREPWSEPWCGGVVVVWWCSYHLFLCYIQPIQGTCQPVRQRLGVLC